MRKSTEKERKSIRTIAWTHGIGLKIGTLGSCAMQKATKIPNQYWDRYKNGAHAVSLGTRNLVAQNLVERKIPIPGSSQTYDVGPKGMPLWDALWSDDYTNLWAIARHVPIEVLGYETANSRKTASPEFQQEEDRYINSLIAFFNDHMLHGSAWPDASMNARLVIALIAAYRCSLDWHESAFYQQPVGDCLKKTLQYDKDLHSTAASLFSSYGILDYVRQYVCDLTASLEPDPRKYDPIYIPIKFPWLRSL